MVHDAPVALVIGSHGAVYEECMTKALGLSLKADTYVQEGDFAEAVPTAQVAELFLKLAIEVREAQ